MKTPVLFTLIVAALCGTAHAQQRGSGSEPLISGAMRNVMRLGQLQATIALDTITPREHLYGMGPVDSLTGEITVWDGTIYSSVVSGKGMKVQQRTGLKAPFFARARVERWRAVPLPDSVRNMHALEAWLQHTTDGNAFFFRLEGVVTHASIHVVNLPKGTKVSSPEDAHKGKQNYEINNTPCDVLGFFSTRHQTIFTRHDTYLHMHLLTKDRRQMGHLDELTIDPGKVKFFLPDE